MDIVVAVKSTQADKDAVDAWGCGSLAIMSAPEVFWAFLLSVKRHIDIGTSDEELEPFRQAMAHAPMKFKLNDNEGNRWWGHQQLREDISELGTVLKRSTIERGWDVMHAKNMLAKAGLPTGAEACAKEWASKVKLSRASEPLTSSYVDAVFTVWPRIMDHDDLSALILRCENELEKSPWDSMYKLEALKCFFFFFKCRPW